MTGTALTVSQRRNELLTQLDQYTPQIQDVLPSHIKIEKFKAVVRTAINLNPDLVDADRRSLFVACINCARDGLLPDNREAALVLFGKNAQYMPMIGGIRKRMRNSGEVLSAEAHVVYEKDKFDYALGDEPHLTHKPVVGDRGKAIGAYAIIKLKNGEILREVMSIPELEKVRAVSRAKNNGPWISWTDEMYRKTVLRRCAKAAPTEADVEELFQRHEEAEDAAVQAGAVEIPPRLTRAAAPELPPAAIVDEDGVVQQYADEGPQVESENPEPRYAEPPSPIGKKGKEWDRALAGWSAWLRSELPAMATPEDRQALIDSRPKEWADLMQFRRSEADAALALIRP